MQRAQLQPRLGDDLATSRFDDKNKLLFARVGKGQSVVGRLVLEGSMIGGVRGENGDIAYRLRVSNPDMKTMRLVMFLQVQVKIVAISTRMFC